MLACKRRVTLTSKFLMQVYSPACERRCAFETVVILTFCALEPLRAVRAERLQRPEHLLAARVDGLLPASHQRAVSEPVRLET